MNEVNRSSRFIENSLKVHELYIFNDFLIFSAFVVLFVNLKLILIIERSYSIPCVSKFKNSTDIMS